MTTDLTTAIEKSRARTLMAAKCFSRVMAERGNEITLCHEQIIEVLDAADQLTTLEAMEHERPT